MIAQIINLAPPDIFKYYMKKYGASDNRYSFGYYGLELRELRNSENEILDEGLTKIGELFYRTEDQDSIFLLGSIRKFKAVANRLSNSLSARISASIIDCLCCK